MNSEQKEIQDLIQKATIRERYLNFWVNYFGRSLKGNKLQQLKTNYANAINSVVTTLNARLAQGDYTSNLVINASKYLEGLLEVLHKEITELVPANLLERYPEPTALNLNSSENWLASKQALDELIKKVIDTENTLNRLKEALKNNPEAIKELSQVQNKYSKRIEYLTLQLQDYLLGGNSLQPQEIDVYKKELEGDLRIIDAVMKEWVPTVNQLARKQSTEKQSWQKPSQPVNLQPLHPKKMSLKGKAKSFINEIKQKGLKTTVTTRLNKRKLEKLSKEWDKSLAKKQARTDKANKQLWNSHTIQVDWNDLKKEAEFSIALDLLADYAKVNLYTGSGGKPSLFDPRDWRKEHIEAVSEVVKEYKIQLPASDTPPVRDVKVLLEKLVTAVNADKKGLNPNGQLNAILNVIKKKCNINDRDLTQQFDMRTSGYILKS